MTLEKIQSALHAYGVDLYRDESSYPVPRAQRALSGRTHYVDDDTMKYFGARINSSHADHNGLYFYLLESVKHPSMGRVHRAVVFDVFGTVLTERNDGLRKTSKQARADLDAFLASFDPVAHTETELRKRIARDQKRLNETVAALGETA